jgi:signal transduction histidine kinase
MSHLTHHPHAFGMPLRLTIGRRLRDPAFWAIQSVVLVISLFHFALEAGWTPLGPSGELPAAHHIPVILYLIPVTYAGLVYGWEGGVLTGLWAGALASVNIVTFSLDDFEWVLETAFVALVVGIGVAMALPVERERIQRKRAEAAVHRLEALNESAHLAMRARTPAQATNAVLAQLVTLLDLDDAGFILWRQDQPDPVVSATHRSPSDLAPLDQLHSETKEGPTPTRIDGRTQLEATVTAGMLSGTLVVESRRSRLNALEVESFLSALGNQLAVRIENALLLEQEQAMWSTYVALVTKAQEEERRRLARELHDGPAQHLAILVRNLESHANSDPASDENLRESASGILDELRRVARDQRPTLLDDLGIVPALEWLIAETDKRSEISITLTVGGSAGRLEPETEVALYRIAQEAIRNAELHAQASEIDVKIRFDDSGVSLEISDNGTGFEVPISPGGYLRAGRLGLMGMNERAQLVGGSLDIRSSPEFGTVVTALVSHDRRPIKPSSA